MSSFLRYVGIINAAIWFGGTIFFAFVVLPGVFSHDMHQIFPDNVFTFYSGAVALLLFRRFFIMQYVCGAIALLHLAAEKLYLGRALPRFGTTLVAVLLGLGLIGGFWLQPRMERFRQTMYYGATPEQKESARRSFFLWHGISQTANLLILAGLMLHLARVTRSDGPQRYGNFYQFLS